ncbi:MAG: sugar phosphate nucleotidyltransferase [Pseudomonadota bacterium]
MTTREHPGAEPERGVWGIVLAGGEGERMNSLVQSWLGFRRPKQYCTFYGDRPMLSFAVERARRVAGDDRVMTVLGPSHQRHLDAINFDPVGTCFEQPESCGTAAGLLLPVALIRARDPEAIVTALPSDHFIYPETSLDRHLRAAVRAAADRRDKIILLGAVPTHPEPEFGWVDVANVGSLKDGDTESARAFVEKPPAATAVSCYTQGWLWNTMMLTATVDVLWRIARRRFPDLAQRFEAFAEAVHGHHTDALPSGFRSRLRDAYRDLAHYDFSADALQREPERIEVMAMTGVTWNDWGRPHRIKESLDAAGLRAAVPDTLLEAVHAPAGN